MPDMSQEENQGECGLQWPAIGRRVATREARGARVEVSFAVDAPNRATMKRASQTIDTSPTDASHLTAPRDMNCLCKR